MATFTAQDGRCDAGVRPCSGACWRDRLALPPGCSLNSLLLAHDCVIARAPGSKKAKTGEMASYQLRGSWKSCPTLINTSDWVGSVRGTTWIADGGRPSQPAMSVASCWRPLSAVCLRFRRPCDPPGEVARAPIRADIELLGAGCVARSPAHSAIELGLPGVAMGARRCPSATGRRRAAAHGA